MRYAFSGDRQIAVNILKFLKENHLNPLALFVSSDKISTHSKELSLLSGLEDKYIFKGSDFKKESSAKILKDLNLDYIIGIHFPYIIPKTILNIPKIGYLNLHPAYLPYNKGWHTPSWAIMKGEPYGATLHFMAEELDAGDIIHQKRLEVNVTDTADSLYKRALKLEEDVFKEALDDIKSLNPNRIIQKSKGSSHHKKDLDKIREIDLDTLISPLDLINKMRALSTNAQEEAAYFYLNNEKYYISIKNIWKAE